MDDVSCRIVVIASSLEKGALLVDNITALDKNPQSFAISAGQQEPIFHPWSISNRYYTANVHFALHTVNKVYGAVFEGVPAAIVAWTKGEPFEEYMETVQKAMEEHTPDVMLAVRLPKVDQSTKDTEESEDNGAIDAKLIAYGFEYVDASEPLDASRSADIDHQGDEQNSDEGVPNLPRVIDALSTIMWPSMTSVKGDVPGLSNDPRTILRSQSTLEAIIDRDPLAIIQAIQELDSEFSFGDELDGEEAELFKEAYQSQLSDSDSASPELGDGLGFDFRTASPTEFSFSDNTGSGDAFGLWTEFGLDSSIKKPKVSLGFEDDFTVFVSAPVDDVKVVDDDFSHLHLESPSDERATLFPHGGDSLYRSLGSTSDLGDPGSST